MGKTINLENDVEFQLNYWNGMIPSIINKILLKNGISEIQLLEKLNWKKSKLDRILKEEKKIKLRDLIELSIALNCDLRINFVERESE